MKICRDKRGQALVEFAIILPVLLLILMGIVQFGLVINDYLTISNLSREGAREGIVNTSDYEIDNAVLTRAVNIDTTKMTIGISPSEDSRTTGQTLTVTITYNCSLIVPIISNIFGGQVVLTSQTSMRIE